MQNEIEQTTDVVEEVKFEAPEFSMGEGVHGLQFKIDSGKFMDSVFMFEGMQVDSNGVANYTIRVLTLIVNGILRDETEIRIRDEHIIQEFYNKVTTPIFEVLLDMAKSQPGVTDV